MKPRTITDNVKDLFDTDLAVLSNYHTTPTANLFELNYVQTATKLSTHELESCLNLIEETSGEDYRGSSVGWNAKAKKEEMEDEDMMYILIKESNRKRPHASSGSTSPCRKTLRTDPPLPSRSETTCAQTAIADDCDAATRQIKNSDGDITIDIDLVKTASRDILGFMSFMFTKDDPPHEDRDVFYIYEIHMKEVLRGHGLGTKLITFVENAASHCSVSKTMLTVFRTNEKACVLYGKLGYSKDACSPKDRVTRKRVIEADYIIMSKELG